MREARLDRNVFRITVDGRLPMRQADTDERAMLGAARAALAHGYGYFTTSGVAATGTALSLGTNVVRVPGSAVTIVCYTEPPELAPLVYDATSLVEHLGARDRD